MRGYHGPFGKKEKSRGGRGVGTFLGAGKP
jgi:hypothetical protein